MVSLGPVRQVATTLTDLSAVDWAQENTLAVAGSTNRSAVYEVSVDGAQQTALVTDVGARVTHLAVYPANPTYVLPAVMMMYEANGVAYRYRSPFGGDDPERTGAGRATPARRWPGGQPDRTVLPVLSRSCGTSADSGRT